MPELTNLTSKQRTLYVAAAIRFELVEQANTVHTLTVIDSTMPSGELRIATSDYIPCS